MVSTYVCFYLKGVYYVYVYMRMNAKSRENKEIYSHGPYPAAYVSFSGIRVTVARLTIFCLFCVFFIGRRQRSRSCIRDDLRWAQTEMPLPLVKKNDWLWLFREMSGE